MARGELSTQPPIPSLAPIESRLYLVPVAERGPTPPPQMASMWRRSLGATRAARPRTSHRFSLSTDRQLDREGDRGRVSERRLDPPLDDLPHQLRVEALGKWLVFGPHYHLHPQTQIWPMQEPPVCQPERAGACCGSRRGAVGRTFRRRSSPVPTCPPSPRTAGSGRSRGSTKSKISPFQSK